jgi:hypothetical protein
MISQPRPRGAAQDAAAYAPIVVHPAVSVVHPSDELARLDAEMSADIRTCPHCGKDHQPTQAGLRNSYYICRACQVIVNARRRASPTFSQAVKQARIFVQDLNARTLCAHCGVQPIEWHNPEHVDLNRQHFRISALVAGGSPIAAIEAEIERCTPLCRRCHMIEDGRMKAFVALPKHRGRRPRRVPPKPPSPCAECGRLCKPLWRGLCRRDYSRAYRPSRRKSVALCDVGEQIVGRMLDALGFDDDLNEWDRLEAMEQ